MATLSTQVTFENLAVACDAYGLRISGVSDVSNNENLSGLKSLVLLSPDEPEFWNIFSASSEYRDQNIKKIPSAKTAGIRYRLLIGIPA